MGRAFLFSMLLATAAMATDAGPSVATADAGDVADVADGAEASVDARVVALEALLRDELPAGALEDVVGVALDDTDAVAALLEGLRSVEGAIAVDAGTDAGPDDEAALRRLRLQVLELPLGRRQALVARAAERDRKARLDAASVEAAAARRAADEAVREAREAAAAAQGRDRGIAEARLALERVKSAQLAMRSETTTTAAEQASLQATRAARLEARRSLVATADAATADALYGDIVQDLTELRLALDRIVTRSRALPRAPRPGELPVLASSAGLSTEQRAAIATLAQERDALVIEADLLDEERQLLLVEHAEQTARALDAENAVRLEALPRLSAARRRALLGLGAEGLAQLQREVQHAVVVARFLWEVEAPTLRPRLRGLDGFAVTRILLHGVTALALVIVAVVVARRGRRWLEAIKVASAHLLGRQLLTRTLANLITALEVVWEPVVLVVAVVIGGVIVEPVLATAIGGILYALLLAWAVLRLVVKVTHHVIRWLARPQPGALSRAHSDKAFGSIRFVGRAVFALYVFLHATEALVGRGYLYTTAVRVGVVLTIPVFLVLIRRWQDDIIQTYLRLFPTGRLAVAVAGSRGRWYGFFVVVAAFSFVFGQALLSVAGRFVLNFDQTRKALAFVFRHRLERRAREQADDVAPPLPPAVVEALRPHPAVRDDLILERLIDLDDAHADLERWRLAPANARTIGAVVVVGHAGMGKTTWLQAFAAQAGNATKELELEVCWLTLSTRTRDADALVAAVAAAAHVEATTLDALVAALRAGPRRLLVLDDLHHLWLRGSEDRSAWRALQRLIDGVADHVFVVASIATWSFTHIRWAEANGHRFRRVVELSPWSEHEIRQLLGKRTAASGHEVLYDDLVIASADVENREVQLLSTAQEYTRLVWDFADGSPTTALDAWRRSLHPVAPLKLRVRLFPQPPEQVLEELDSVGRFALAAVLWNDVVTAADAAVALCLPQETVADSLRRLHEQGVLRLHDGHYRLEPAWWSVATRALRRKHLIAD